MTHRKQNVQQKHKGKYVDAAIEENGEGLFCSFDGIHLCLFMFLIDLLFYVRLSFEFS